MDLKVTWICNEIPKDLTNDEEYNISAGSDEYVHEVDD